MKANLTITSSQVKSNGEIVGLEVNGQNVALANSVKFDDVIEETIDVSTYTEPIEIVPTTGKDGIKKVIITLENIPDGE